MSIPNPTRRQFLQVATTGSLSYATASLAAADLRAPNTILHTPLHKCFDAPIRITDIAVLQDAGNFFVKLTSNEGEAVIAANGKMPNVLSLMSRLVIPFFKGKDARDIETLIDDVYLVNSNYKYAGMPFWIGVAHVELAVWDLLGLLAKKPVGELIAPTGKVLRDRIAVYISRFDRHSSPQQELAAVKRAIEKTGATATKLKTGLRMSTSAKQNQRDLAMAEAFRQHFGDDFTIYLDANGSYTADEAIKLGKEFEKFNVGFLEEPCRWQDHEATRKVADALDLTIAGGEQDSSLAQFRYMTQKRVVDLIQPDIFYNGGLIRCLRVARFAHQVGRKITPHSPKTGNEAAPMLHFASVVPNLGPHQEYRDSPEVNDGFVAVPKEAGLGVTIDAGKLRRARRI